MASVADQLNAALIGRYAIQRELGSGGMATVFLADDLRHRRKVAIKVLHRELAAVLGRERFLREIEIAAGLSHPHILPLYDSGAADDLLYFVMPYVEGESLRQRLEREKQLPVADALRIARDVADALEHAHGLGVVHRDLKPENILLQGQHAVLADFGIARAVVAAGGEKLTATGVVIGTPVYMSPEQGAGSPDLDGRSDVYGLGCVVYEMLAGQPPFTGPTTESLAHQHLNVPPRPVTDLRPTVPAQLSSALQRALSKAAADRFKTAAEFATALAAGAESVTAPTPAPPPPAPWYRRRPVIAAGSAAAIILVALAAWKVLIPPPVPQPAKKEWILVAEFDGPAADSAVVAATRDLVMAGLDQSEIVATVPRDQIRMALESAGKPTSTRVDAELARELAYRSAVRTVLEGRIGRLGKGYSIVLRLLDADTVRTLVSVSDAAADEGALIPAVSRISRKLRAELGERRSAIQGTTELFWITTPSFEAYKLFRRGVQLHWDGDQRGAITLMRRAIALDPDFAAAWGTMGFCFGNLNEVDSSLAAFDQALVRPQRLDEQFKLLNAAMVASTKNDLTGALVALEELLRLNPENRFAHNNRGAVLSSLGRLDEALESIRTAKRLSPFGPTAGNLHNEFWYLLQLHRLDEARQLAPKLSGSLAASAPMWIAAASGEWPTAEGAATALENSLDADLRFQSEGILAAARASRGEVKSAEQVLRRPRSDAGIVGESLIVNRTRWRRLLLALCSHGVTTVPGGAGRWDSTTAGLVTRGAWAAAEGDTALAQRLLAAVRTRSAPQVSSVGFMPAVVEAWIAARAGRWEDVVRDLGPLALQGDATGFVGLQSAPLAPWLVAEAYEHLDRPDSAAAYFERVFTPPPTGDAMYYLPQIGMASSFAHRRLVLLYARMGRLEDARRHWEIFSAAFTHPDPEMRPLVEEARAALESAEGMARTARQ